MNLLSVPFALLKLVFTVARMLLVLSLGALFGMWFSFLILCATPFWLVELLFSRGALASVRPAAMKNCESFLDWMFSRSNPDQTKQHLTFVRLWGLEFQYR